LECGTLGSGSPTNRLSVKYYLVAMIFILFDVEVVFIYSVAFKAVKLGWYGYFVMVFLFGGLWLQALIYIWKRGVPNWNE